MARELSSQYDSQAVEPEINRLWMDSGAFHAEPDGEGAPYCIVIPPPNVTAALHIGHALNNTLQDILIRYHRMRGDNTVWVPGTDHAGIATQTVVEKRVLAEEGRRRTDFERDEFVAKIQAWKDEYERQILDQLKAMGCSCDWDRTRFTMDQVCARAVREAFFRLFRDGLIYRGKRLVNWDPATQTALADDEVETHEIDGHFWYLQYPLVEPVKIDGETIDHVTVATTRPETMLGDTAVAINPHDPRANALVGKQVRLPIVDRIIPIVEDDYVVRPDPNSDDVMAQMATGFLKVTPAHDPNDWDIGQRHDLPIVNVLAPDGSISDQYGWHDVGGADFLLGLDRYEAREAIVEWFRENQLLESVTPYHHSVGHSYRSHVAIEPYLSDQWYVKVTDDRLAGAALRAMADDQYDASTTRDQNEKSRDRKGAEEEALPDGRASLTGHRGSSEQRDTPFRTYLITFTCYGTWLHGDKRGSVDRDHNAPGAPCAPEDAKREQQEFLGLKQAPVTLDGQEREVVGQTIAGVCNHRGWRLLAGQVRSNHLHVVVHADVSPERVMNDFKSYATRALTEAGLIRAGTRVWTRHGSTRYLFTKESIDNACAYVYERQGESLEGAEIQPPYDIPTEPDTTKQSRDREGAEASEGAEQSEEEALPDGRASLRKRTSVAWEGALRFFPARYAKTYQAWHENIRDWCISRQLWWGHRIPVWRKRVTLTEDNWSTELLGWGWDSYVSGNWAKGGWDVSVQMVRVSDRSIVDPKVDPLMPVVAETEGEYDIYVCVLNDKDASLFEKDGFARDPDVLDTWFSSALWPFSTLGWPEETPELAVFNPGSVLCTAREIITLWVSRMVMTNLYFLDRLPFKHVYIHAMIQDGLGRKMSKSLGNGVDPIDIIEKYGADAMRYSLSYLATGMQDIRLPVKKEKLADGREINTSERFEIGRNLCTKVWNAARFVLMGLDENGKPEALTVSDLPREDRWILSRLNACISQTTKTLDEYLFAEASLSVYRFFWNEFCDWYLEWIKPRLRESDHRAGQVAAFCLDRILRLMHPFMPFISEKLWQELNAASPRRGIDAVETVDTMLVISPWPEVQAELIDETVEQEMDLLQELIRAIRDIRGWVNRLRAGEKEKSVATLPTVMIRCDDRNAGRIEQARDVICQLANVDALAVNPDDFTLTGSAGRAVTDASGSAVELAVPVAELIDIEQARKRLSRELQDTSEHIKRSEQRLANPKFTDKAPPHIVEEHRQTLETLRNKRSAIARSLEELH